MIILGGTSDKLQVYSTSAVTVDAHASWTDYDGTTLTPGRTNTALTAATTTYDVVGSPTGTNKRNVKALTLRNKHASSSNLLIVKHTDGSTTPELISYTLLAGETLQYFEKQGWTVMDAAGNLKQLTAPSGRFLKTTFLGVGVTTFRASPYTNSIFIRVQAGGGGGGGASRAANAPGQGGGGAAGGYAEKFFAVSPNTTYACVVGAGGAGGAAGANNGSPGTLSSFTVGGTTVTANGGPAGIGMATGSTRLSALGGASPAVSTNGDLNSGGRPGDNGLRGGTTLGCSGSGGSSMFGAGGSGLNAQGSNAATIGWGGGGSGAYADAANTAGGNGANGVIIVEEYE